MAAIKFGVSQNKVIYVNLAAIKFGVSPRPVYAVYDRRICWRRQILAKTRNSPNSPNIIARQNLLIYSTVDSSTFLTLQVYQLAASDVRLAVIEFQEGCIWHSVFIRAFHLAFCFHSLKMFTDGPVVKTSISGT